MNQEHLWYLDQIIPGTQFFNMPYLYHLNGDLNVEALEKALKEIVHRHAALRTVFDVIHGDPVQIVNKNVELDLVKINLRCTSPSKLSQRSANLILKERERPFQLATGPLFRTLLLELNASTRLLLVTMHHIISDYWSMQLFRQELVALYKAFSEDRRASLKTPVVQYSDYAVWERQLLNLGLFDKQVSYWTTTLAPPLPKLIFSNKHTHRMLATLGNKSKQFELDGTFFESLKSKSTSQNCTPFMLFMTALNISLHTLTGQEDIRIATMVSNRNIPQFHVIICNFANTVILRTHISDDLIVDEAIQRVRKVIIAAQLNQEVPFEFLGRALRRQPSWNADSLANVLVMYDRSGFHSSTLSGITFAPLNSKDFIPHAAPILTTYAITFRVKEMLTKLTGTINFRADTCNPRTTARLTPFLVRILMAILSQSDRTTVGNMVAGTALK